MMHTNKTRPLVIAAFAILTFCTTVLCSTDPVAYKIRVSTSDLSGYDIEMRIKVRDGMVRVAMAAHPEYDDRYFRYVRNLSAESGSRRLSVTKPEENVWQIDGVRSELILRYRIAPDLKEREWRQSWKPFLTPTGGLVGELHMLMYVVGEEKRPARLTLDMPAGWKAVSGLESTDDPRTFAGSVELLLDSPIMVGDIREWKFNVAGVPHTVAIWSPLDAKPLDSVPIVEGIQRLAEQAVKAFGKPPYPRYAFLLEKGGQAALEHRTSLSAGLYVELSDLFEEVAHEYIHVWNLMDVRPCERIGLKHKFAEPTGVLWWSEGATIMFADLLIRRAGLSGDPRSRGQRLESLIARYLSAPGYSMLSAELVSRGDTRSELMGDNWAGTHLQGEVLVTMLDLKIREATNGGSSADDVMRLLADRFDPDHGITNPDIERAVADICRCETRTFFDEHIYSAKQIEFDRYLGLIGMRAEIKYVRAVDSDGKASVDGRIGPMSVEGGLKLRVTNSNSVWARSGVRTGDLLVSANGGPIVNWQEFRVWLGALKVGDAARLIVVRDGVTKTVEVPLTSFDVPQVRLVELDNAAPKPVRLRQKWLNSN